MGAAELNMVIEKGVTFRQTYTYMTMDEVIIPLTGYKVKMQIRKNYRFKDNAQDLLAEYTTENGFITVDEPNGKIFIVVPPEETDKYKWYHGLYDLIIVAPNGQITRLLNGYVKVSPNITAI